MIRGEHLVNPHQTHERLDAAGRTRVRRDADLSRRHSTLPRVIRQRSSLHGCGVFAAEPINKNRRIIDYAGELIRNSDSAEREARYLEQGCIWVFRINRAWS